MASFPPLADLSECLGIHFLLGGDETIEVHVAKISQNDNFIGKPVVRLMSALAVIHRVQCVVSEHGLFVFDTIAVEKYLTINS